MDPTLQSAPPSEMGLFTILIRSSKLGELMNWHVVFSLLHIARITAGSKPGIKVGWRFLGG